jgi:protein-tyrosine phosphatase
VGEPARILTVCSGNVCRSPFIERALQAELDRSWGPGRVLVRSAGTVGLVGQAMEPAAVRLLDGHGYQADGFVARVLAADMVAEADLVLAATQAHRGRVAMAHPKALRYAFTLREFAHLLRHVPTEDLPTEFSDDPREHVRAVVRLALARRGMQAPLPESELDVVDPYRRKDAVFASMAEQIMTALPVLSAALGRP